MSTALLVMKTAIFFAGIASGYVALVWPLFARGLVYSENEVPFPETEKNPAAVKASRRFLLSLTILGCCAGGTIALSMFTLAYIRPVAALWPAIFAGLGFEYVGRTDASLASHETLVSLMQVA